MSLGLCFWILMLLWFVFGLWWHWPSGAQSPSAFGPIGWNALLFILLLLLGWHAFGAPLHA